MELLERKKNKDPAFYPFLFLIWAFLFLFVLFPLAKLIGAIFVSKGGFTLENIKSIFSRSFTRKAFLNSMILAVAVSLSGAFLGFLFALIVTRTRIPKFYKALISMITLLPLISPPFTSSMALTFALGPNGMLLNFFGIKSFPLYGFVGTWISETLTYFPVAFMVISAVLSTMNASLDDAACSLGATRMRVLGTITLPMSMSAIGNSILLVFSSSLADFATPLILGGQKFPTLTTEAYLQITGLFDLPGGATLSFLLVIPALLVFWAQRKYTGNKSYVTVTGKNGAASVFTPLPRSVSVTMYILCSVVIAFIVYLYGILFWASFVKVWGVDNSFTLANYKYVATFGMKAIKDTLIVAFFSTAVGSILGLAIGYLIQRRNFLGRKTMEFVSLLNYALPGTVIGIAYIIAFNKKPIILTGTVTILVAAYVSRYYATGIRSVMTSLEQIDVALEEASLSLGAGPIKTLFHVTVPLIVPAVLSGMRYLFIHSMTAISATIFLVSVKWTLLTTRILESMNMLQFTQACAFSVVLIVIVFLADLVMTMSARLYENQIVNHKGKIE